MKNKKHQRLIDPTTSPLLRVRTGVRSGDELSACKKEVKQLDRQYKELVAEARACQIPFEDILKRSQR